MSTQFTLTATLTLVTEECCNCHIVFGMPKALQDILFAQRGPGPNRRQFYCPNGDPQFYIGETEAQRLKRELDATQRRLDHSRGYADQLANDNMDLAKSNRALKGAKTKLLRRITNGVCACCGRSFANVQRHMATKHPGEVVSAEAAARA